MIGELWVDLKFCELFKDKVKLTNFSVKLYLSNKMNLLHYLLLMHLEFAAYG